MSAPFTPEQEAFVREIVRGPAISAEVVGAVVSFLFRELVSEAPPAPAQRPGETSRTRGGSRA